MSTLPPSDHFERPQPEVAPQPLGPHEARVHGGIVGDDKPADISLAGIDAKAREYMAAHPGTPYVAAYKAVGGK